jgi:hypothetical protein
MRLLACISHHGFGHLAQSAPVLNSLLTTHPHTRLLVRSALPRERLAARIHVPFEHYPEAADCGFPMRDALRIDMPATLAAYRAFHRDWDRRVATEARWLVEQEVQAVFSNVAYLPLAAAHQARLPGIALCSLNWADIFAHYFAPAGLVGAQAGEILLWESQMRTAYRGARMFLRPTPSMEMNDLPNRIAIAPIAGKGRKIPDELRARLAVRPEQKLVLIGMGGIGYRPPVEDWPQNSDIVWLVPDEWRATHTDTRTFNAAGMPFIDMLASCDALVSKPGYGSFTEAAAHGVPVLYLPRPDWPESPALEAWLHVNTRAIRIDEAAVGRGQLAQTLAQLWRQQAPPAPRCEGASEAARLLAELLD